MADDTAAALDWVMRGPEELGPGVALSLVAVMAKEALGDALEGERGVVEGEALGVDVVALTAELAGSAEKCSNT